MELWLPFNPNRVQPADIGAVANAEVFELAFGTAAPRNDRYSRGSSSQASNTASYPTFNRVWTGDDPQQPRRQEHDSPFQLPGAD